MSSLANTLVSMPCLFKGCKFKARCRISKDFMAPEARGVCRKALHEHWALCHSTEADKRLMMTKLGIK